MEGVLIVERRWWVFLCEEHYLFACFRMRGLGLERCGRCCLRYDVLRSYVII